MKIHPIKNKLFLTFLNLFHLSHTLVTDNSQLHKSESPLLPPSPTTPSTCWTCHWFLWPGLFIPLVCFLVSTCPSTAITQALSIILLDYCLLLLPLPKSTPSSSFHAFFNVIFLLKWMLNKAISSSNFFIVFLNLSDIIKRPLLWHVSLPWMRWPRLCVPGSAPGLPYNNKLPQRCHAVSFCVMVLNFSF